MLYTTTTLTTLIAFALCVHSVDLDGIEVDLPGYVAIPAPPVNKYLSEDLADDLPVQTDEPSLTARSVAGQYPEYGSYEPTHVPEEDQHQPVKARGIHEYFHSEHPGYTEAAKPEMLLTRDAEDVEVDYEAYPPVPDGADLSFLSTRGAEDVEIDYNAYPPVPDNEDISFLRARDIEEIDYEAYPPAPDNEDLGFLRARDEEEIDYNAYPPIPENEDLSFLRARDVEEVDYNAYPPVPSNEDLSFLSSRNADDEEIDYNAYPPVPENADLSFLSARNAEPEASEPTWKWWKPTMTGSSSSHTHPSASTTGPQHGKHTMATRSASSVSSTSTRKGGWAHYFPFLHSGKEEASESAAARRHHARSVNMLQRNAA